MALARLSDRAKRYGVWDDFGQETIQWLKSKYGCTPEVKKLDQWCTQLKLRR